MVFGPNVTGWEELMDGNMIGASFIMYDTAFAGFVIAILFVVYQIMLYHKTQNLTLCWITGAIFATMYVSAKFIEPIVHPASLYIIWTILVFELGIIFYATFFK